MTDKELLELAAKAAGIKYNTIAERVGGGFYCENGYGECVFDPLTDDGDVLRLAHKLGLLSDVPVWPRTLEETRRAIVRAAAEIGRQIE